LSPPLIRLPKGGSRVNTAHGTGQYNEPFGGVEALRFHAVGGAAEAEDVRWLLALLWLGDWVKQGIAQAGDQDAARFEHLQALRFQRRWGMGPGAAVAVVIGKASGTANLLEGMPLQEQRVGLREAVGLGDEHQGPLPEVLLLVVGC